MLNHWFHCFCVDKYQKKKKFETISVNRVGNFQLTHSIWDKYVKYVCLLYPYGVLHVRESNMFVIIDYFLIIKRNLILKWIQYGWLKSNKYCFFWVKISWIIIIRLDKEISSCRKSFKKQKECIWSYLVGKKRVRKMYSTYFFFLFYHASRLLFLNSKSDIFFSLDYYER
jgi:hypothetical protein